MGTHETSSLAVAEEKEKYKSYVHLLKKLSLTPF